MASISRDGPKGGWRIQLALPDGRRVTIRLGPVDKRMALSIKTHVEHLAAARAAGAPLPLETAGWLARLDGKLRDRLAKCGLTEEKHGSGITLREFLDAYLKRRTDAKESTQRRWKQAVRSLLRFFGEDRPLPSITAGDAQDFARWLKTPEARVMRYAEREKGEALSRNTTAKRVQMAKQFFADAVDRELLPKNPFAKLTESVGHDKARDAFVTVEDACKVLEACPDAEWRALFALARWGALRIPSEIVELTWSDIDWERSRLRVRSPKTEHHAGRGERIIPLFPELRQALEELWDATPEGTVYVITRYRKSTVNLRTQLQKIIRRAGVTPWPKLWQNLRATRATELAREYPQHVAAAWCGHTVQIADRHYWQVTDEDFQRATAPATPDHVRHGSLGDA